MHSDDSYYLWLDEHRTQYLFAELLPTEFKAISGAAIYHLRLVLTYGSIAHSLSLTVIEKRAGRMIFLTDATGQCVYASTEWAKLTGQETKDALGRGWLARVHSDDRSGVEDIINQATQQGAEFNVRYRLLKPDDTCRWVAAGGIPSFGLLGDAFAGYLGTITELAEGATDTIRAYGKVERFRPPAPYQTTTPASALDRVADHLIMAHSLIEDDGGKRALPDLRNALFKIGQALAAQVTERERLN